MFDSPLSVDTLLLFVGLSLALYKLARKKAPRPPGPKGYPIIGNVFDMPSINECDTFAKWRDQYGLSSHSLSVSQHH